MLREEMRRVLSFLEWHAQWWLDRRSLVTELSPDAAEGAFAYASRQAHIRESLRSAFEHTWRSSAEFAQLGVGADHDILDLDSAASEDILQAPLDESLP
jgi:hypothetical protein